MVAGNEVDDDESMTRAAVLWYRLLIEGCTMLSLDLVMITRTRSLFNNEIDTFLLNYIHIFWSGSASNLTQGKSTLGQGSTITPEAAQHGVASHWISQLESGTLHKRSKSFVAYHRFALFVALFGLQPPSDPTHQSYPANVHEGGLLLHIAEVSGLSHASPPPLKSSVLENLEVTMRRYGLGIWAGVI